MKVNKNNLVEYGLPEEKIDPSIEVNDVLEEVGLHVDIDDGALLLKEHEPVELRVDGFSDGKEAHIAQRENRMYEHTEQHMELLDTAIHDNLRSMGARKIVNSTSLGRNPTVTEGNYSVYRFSYKNVNFIVKYEAPNIGVCRIRRKD